MWVLVLRHKTPYYYRSLRDLLYGYKANTQLGDVVTIAKATNITFPPSTSDHAIPSYYGDRYCEKVEWVLIIDDCASYYFKEFHEMTEWVASVNTRDHRLMVASLTDLSWANLDNLLKIQVDVDNRPVTIHIPLPKLEPIQGIPLFDWDDNRNGILLARVRLTVPNYTVDQKTRVLDELITSIKSGSTT